jgi:hypothetical protein
MAGITTYLSVLILNVDGLNTPIKRYRLVNWIKKTQCFLVWEKPISWIEKNIGLG